MKLGAQFFTLRERCKTEEGLYESFKKIHEIGYQVAQMSAICQIDPYKLKSFSDEFELPITCTHSPLARITDDTDALIKEHKIYGCPVIGLGYMPDEYHGSVEGCRKFLSLIEEPIKRIKDAGLTFAYHNHAFEFDDLGGICAYDLMIEESPDMNFILDTYWVKYAERDYLSYIKQFGSERMTNIHFKDMKSYPKGAICPCGEGVIDFSEVVELCGKLGIPYALVEQDNAPKLGDEFEQMKLSYDNLCKFF